MILVSHGHSDHFADVVPVARATGAAVIGLAEMEDYLEEKGLRNVRGMNAGGTQDVNGTLVTMTGAVHSGSTMVAGQPVYLGGAAGFVVRAPHTPTFYFAGDTALFGDMRMLGDIYRPEIAFLPIGDHFTMGPDTAAIAARWLGVRLVVPMHWGTMAKLTGTPAALKEHLTGSGIEVLEMQPGETAE
jgi:L-ascorbate metabolism protein UlaG (beta-lactamase superfamily)